MNIDELTWLWQGVTTGIVIAVIVGLVAVGQRSWLRRKQIADLRKMVSKAHRDMMTWDTESHRGKHGAALKAIYARLLDLLGRVLSRPDLQLTYTQSYDLQEIVADARRLFDSGVQADSLNHYNEVFFSKIESLSWLGFRVAGSE